MKKKILFFTVMFSFIFVGQSFASEDDDKIIYAMLMNQIQYSLQVINHYQDKIILDQEYDNIICKIDKTKLKDDKQESITAYANMLLTLTNLKLGSNEKLFVTQQAEKEKSEAMYTSLEGTVLPAVASAYQVGQGISKKDVGAIISGVTSFVYTGISAKFNYRHTINSIENNLNQELFKLNQDQLKTIDGQRAALFKTYSKFITTYNIPKEYEIKEDQMSWLVSTLDSTDSKTKVRLLNEKKDIFAIFTPFWYELGAAYQDIGNFSEAKKCYAEFERQKAKYSIIDNDTYYTELSKNMIQILLKENNLTGLNKYLNIIEQDHTVNNESENRFYLAGVYYILGNMKKAQSFLKLVIDENKKFVIQARELNEVIQASSQNDSNFRIALLLSQIKIASAEESQKVISNVKEKKNIFQKFVGIFADPEDIKTLDKDNLTFILPEYYGNKYSLSIYMDGKYYDSVDCSFDDKHYYFVNYPVSKFCSKVNDFELILNDSENNEYSLTYSSDYIDSKDTKVMVNAFNVITGVDKNSTLDISDISQINIKSFIQEIKNSEKEKDFNKKLPADKEKKYRENFDYALTEFLTAPYFYKNNILQFKNTELFVYRLTKISDKKATYEFSKYGDLIESSEVISTIPSSKIDLYKKAIIGNSEAQYDLGMSYMNGESIDIDYFEAIKWFKQSAGNGNMNAFYQLGICFESGFGTVKSSDRAQFYYQKAANLGHQKAKEKIK